MDRGWWSGRVPAGWDVGRLKDLVDLTNGWAFDSERFSDSSGTPLIRIRDLLRGNTETFYDGPVPPGALVEYGDLLVGMDGDFNSATWSGSTAALNQRLCRLRAVEPLTQGYLRYLIDLPLRYINDLTYATTVKHLSSIELLDERIPLPEPKLQRAIADFLDTETTRIDALIVRKRQLSDLLQRRMARQLEGAVLAGDAPHVPLRWHMRVRSGEALPAHEVQGSGPTRIVGGNGVMGWSTRGTLVQKPAIAVGRVGALCGNVHAVDPPAWITDNALWLHSFEGMDRDFLVVVLKALHLNELADRTAQPLLTGEKVKSLVVPLPPLDHQRSIVAHLNTCERRINRLRQLLGEQVSLLAERRQALITATVTGELEVRGVAA